MGSTLGMHVPFIYRTLQNNYSYSSVKPSSRDNVSKPSSRDEPLASHRRSTKHLTKDNSQLSNVGTNSLKSLNRYISDKEVYDKQQKGYNIISVQPKEYEDTIKVYPKYRLENEDRNYYKKLQIEKEISNKLNTNKLLLQQLANPETQKRAVRGKYLNNVDEVADIM